MVRSKPLFDDEMALDYIVCVCGRDYCNYEPQMQKVDANWTPNDLSTIYPLNEENLGAQKELAVINKRVVVAHAVVSDAAAALFEWPFRIFSALLLLALTV
ncbi:hypothetical protein L596_028002 [Steinernema carpocapsae]|uniref:Uncharacterized protein n=1 Tax=Steinernema carpocapsae TaxID=34508 RepID=A0A4V5ZXR2_STECR|nr:hypothetical protein L596_028002 [Steinernema carpocapsae]